MELINRYVEAVGSRITAPRRNEIEAELRAAILDALEARNATPDSETDVMAVLAEFGAPEAVAAEYEPSRRYLIGPELYPEFLPACAWRSLLVTVHHHFGWRCGPGSSPIPGCDC